jgi:hypothetical protein
MKHTLSALALASLTAGAFAQSAPAPVAATASDLAVRGGISWSGKNVFRGKERSGKDGLIQSDITAEYNIPGFSGVSAYLSFFSADSFERVYVLGARTDDALGRLDVGIQRSAAVFRNANGSRASLTNNGYTLQDSNREIYIGQSFKSLPLAPVATLYYSTDLKEITVDLAASKSFKGAELGLPGFDVVVKANLGLSDASDANGDIDGGAKVKNAYTYIGASVDVTRAVGQGAVVGAGLNYAYNTDGQTAVQGSAAFLKVFANFKF